MKYVNVWLCLRRKVRDLIDSAILWDKTACAIEVSLHIRTSNEIHERSCTEKSVSRFE